MDLGIGSRVEHLAFGKGVVVECGSDFYNIWFKSQNAVKSISINFEGLNIISAKDVVPDVNEVVSMVDLELALNKILDSRADIQELVHLGNKWKGGTFSLQPEDKSLQAKQVPIETFFHKIVMVRDRLRVLEANINAHKVLSDEEKVDLQQYITRCYGSLTTFNVLFKNEHEQFRGSSVN